MGVSLYTIDYSSLVKHFKIPGISSMSNTENNERRENWALVEYGNGHWMILELLNGDVFNLYPNEVHSPYLCSGKISDFKSLDDFFNVIKDEIFSFFYRNDIEFYDSVFEAFFKIKKREIILNNVKNK